jgi:hypothetical protein
MSEISQRQRETISEIVTRLMLAELSRPGATKRSLGAIYALALGYLGTDDLTYRRLNDAIRDARDIRFLDHVKRIGWEIWEAMKDE